METTKTYHIDVTQEEDQLFKDEIPSGETNNKKTKIPSKFAFLKIFCVVLGVHVAAAVIVGFGSITANAASVSEDKKFVGQDEAEYQTTTNSTAEVSPTPTPGPTPNKPLVTSSSKEDWPKPAAKPVITQPSIETKKSEPKQQNTPTKHNNKLVSQYTVKQGDTIIGIAKRYKLNAKRLMQINNIKDPTKLKIGQKLKFM